VIETTTPSAAPRRVFVQYLNPEILRLYGARSRFTERGLLERALRITRYAALISEQDIILPQSYLYEVHYVDAFLRSLSVLRHAALLSVASETAEAAAYVPRKRREYRGELTLFDAYGAEPDDELIGTLEWAPRVLRSTAADIAAEWRTELQTDGLWDKLLTRTAKAGLNRLPSLLDSAIESVPDRLDGQAFILRFALPLLPAVPDGRAVTQIDMLLSRAYTRSYLHEFGALILYDTPLGDLSCGLPQRSPEGRVQMVSYRRLGAFFAALGVRDIVERRLAWTTLLALRSEPVLRWAIGLLVEQQPPRLAIETAAMLRSRFRPPSQSNSRLLADVLDRLWTLYESLAPALEADAADLAVPPPLQPVRRRRGAEALLIQPTLWGKVSATKNNDVFVVCGRDSDANEGMKAMLRAASITPVEWEEAVRWTGSGAPYVLEVLDAAFARVQAVLILFTPDEVVRLDTKFVRPGDPVHEKRSGRQARPNVLVEAGMALALQPTRTVIVELALLRPLTDLQGLHTVHFDGSPKSRKAVLDRLETAGCHPRGSDYLTAGFGYMASP
jgi:hypothetical protein